MRNKSTYRSIHRLLPILDDEAWEYYCKQRDCFWVAAEIDLSGDALDLRTMREPEQRVLLHILAFFAASDAIVTEKLALSLYEDAPNQECRMFYSMQMAIESVHTETYNLLLQTLVQDDATKDVLFDAAVRMPSVAAKAKWFEENSTGTWAERLLVQAIVEGIHFSASFAYIFWVKHRMGGKFAGLTLSNEFIARDEGLHRDFSLMLYRTKLTAEERLEESHAHRLVQGAVDVETQFVEDAFAEQGLLGLNAKLLVQYVQLTADHLLSTAGHQKLYGVKNPLDFMEQISLQGKTNFFEKRVSEYSKVREEGRANEPSASTRLHAGVFRGDTDF